MRAGWSKIAVASLLALNIAMAAAAELWVVNKGRDQVQVLSLQDGRVLANLQTGIGPHEVATSPDGALAVVADFGVDTPGYTLQIYDARARRFVREVDISPHNRPHGLAFLPDSRRLLVTAEGSGHLLLVDAVSGRLEAQIRTGQAGSHMVAVDSAGSRAYVANIASSSLSVIDLARWRLIETVPAGAQAEGVTLAGGEVWVSNRAADSLSVFDSATLEWRATLPSAGFPIRAVTSRDGQHVLVTNPRSAQLAVFDTASRREIQRLDLRAGLPADTAYANTALGRGAFPVGVTSSDKRVFVAVAGADHIAVIDKHSWQIVARWPTGREPDGLAIAVHATP